MPTKQTTAMPGGFTKRENEFGDPWSPEIGEVLTGTLIAYKKGVNVRTQRGSADVAIVRDEREKIWSVWISAGLNGVISADDVGSLVWIKRVDDAPAQRGRNAMKQYEVGIKPA